MGNAGSPVNGSGLADRANRESPGEYLEDLFTGDASPEMAAEMWHDLLFRCPPERAAG